MITYSIFVIDDEKTITDGITMALEGDCRVKSFYKAETAIEAMQEDCPDLILLDIGLPEMNGVEALRLIKSSHPDILVIMITAYEDIDTVISAMRLGAYDYVIKPLHMEELEVTIRNALDTLRLKKEIQQLQEKHLKENIPCFIAE
ncbi:MAG: response regulator, partial [Desulfobacterales bacterium]|nr:response regulator [Desulfobacterales bacterium]